MLSPNTLRDTTTKVMDDIGVPKCLQPKKRKRPTKKDAKAKAEAKAKEPVWHFDKLPDTWRPEHHMGQCRSCIYPSSLRARSSTAAQKTSSTHRTAVFRGAHKLDILGYTTRRRLGGADNTVRSRSFDAGGFLWTLVCRFHEKLARVKGVTLVSVSLELSRNETDEAVVATASVRIDDPSGTGRWPAAEWHSEEPNVFPVRSSTAAAWELAVPDAFREHEERYVDEDADRLTVHCTVHVHREESAEGPTSKSCLVSMPPQPSLSKDIHRLREKMWWPDVTFLVEEAKIRAHKLYVETKFQVGGREWMMMVYPSGERDEYKEYIGLFLSPSIHDDTNLKASVTVYLINPSGKPSYLSKFTHIYGRKCDKYGWPGIITVAYTNSHCVGRDGSFTIQCRLEGREMTKRFPRLQLPDGAMGRPAVTGVQHRQQAGVADNPMNMNGPNPVPATNLRSRGATSGADHAENVAGPSVTVVEPKKSRAFLSLGRNKASPARLVKLNEILSPARKTLITEWGWGGMMMVKATEMPVDLSMWVLACFDPIRSELAMPGRGTIPVDAASYNRVFGLPNEGLPIRYEMETEPIAFMNEEYNIQGGSAPGFKQWRKMIQEMGGAADMKFLRAYCAAVVSYFISPSTSANISPRSYPGLIDLNVMRRSNWCQFAVDQIVEEILYLDSLDVDEPVPSIEECPIRAAAWDDKLIQAVMLKDMKSSGEFGKMKLKDGVGVTIRDGLFVGMTRLEEFVSSRLPRNFPWDLEQAEDSAKGVCGRVRRRQRPEPSVVVDEDDDDDADDEDYNADGDEDDEDNEDGDDEDDKDDEDGDNEDGASKEHPSNGQHNEDDDFEDRGAHFENTPRRSAHFENTPRRSARLEKIYPNSIFMEEIARSQRVSPATTPPLEQFRRDTAVQKLQSECIALDKLAIRGDKAVQMKHKRVAHRDRPMDTNGQSEIVQDQMTVKAGNQTATPLEAKTTMTMSETTMVGTAATSANQATVSSTRAATSSRTAAHNTGAAPQPPPVATHAVAQTKIPAAAPFIRTSPRRNKNTRTSPVTPSTCQGSQTNRVAQKSSGPTRETCPPPRPKDPRWEKGCDPPSFDLGFDSPPKNQEQSPVVAASAGITPTSLRSLGSPIFDDYEDVWSPEIEEEEIALCTKVEMEKGYLRAEEYTMGVGHQSEAELQTPTHVANRVTPSNDASGSNSDAAPVELIERRIIRPAACYKSPYIDFSNKNTYACSADVKEVYDLVTSCAKRNGRGQHKDNTPIIVNFEKFFVSQQELANSMMPCAELDNTVFELGLESIMLRKDKDDKKVVMPLRLIEYGWKHKDPKKYFAKKDVHLDKKDLVLLPVLENMSEDPTMKVNHYWLLVLNIKDRRFEVLDSMRTINDKKLALLVKNLQAAITSLWNEHYPKSGIKLEKFDLSDIFAPKQKTNKECGVHALVNAEHWTGRSLPNYGGKDISNIRKLMTYTWVTSIHNTIDWRKALKKKGK
ncbi:hypothetical protein ACQ4PT_027521 [Festuca glaucescens]